MNFKILNIQEYSNLNKFIEDYIFQLNQLSNTYVPDYSMDDFDNLGGLFKWVNFSFIVNSIPPEDCSKASISACILTHNNEKYVRACLDSLQGFVDEIVIIDSNSTDHTKEIVSKRVDKLISVSNNIGFDEKRNIGIDNCSGEWIFMIDSDEVISKDAGKLLRRYISWANKEQIDVFWLPRFWLQANTMDPFYFYSGELCLWPDPQARLFRKKANCRYRGRIHEKIFSLSGRKACMIAAKECALIHLKYWFCTEEELVATIQKRKADLSDALDEVQLLPWKNNMKLEPLKNLTMEDKILEILRKENVTEV